MFKLLLAGFLPIALAGTTAFSLQKQNLDAGYLLKPLTGDRLEKAIRYITRIEKDENYESLENLLAGSQVPTESVKILGRYLLITYNRTVEDLKSTTAWLTRFVAKAGEAGTVFAMIVAVLTGLKIGFGRLHGNSISDSAWGLLTYSGLAAGSFGAFRLFWQLFVQQLNKKIVALRRLSNTTNLLRLIDSASLPTELIHSVENFEKEAERLEVSHTIWHFDVAAILRIAVDVISALSTTESSKHHTARHQ